MILVKKLSSTLIIFHLGSTQRDEFSNPVWFTPVLVVVCIITAIKVEQQHELLRLSFYF